MPTDESQTRSYFVTFSATASTTGTTELELPEGYLTELTTRVEGTITTTDISGGPVRIEQWLRRGQSYRKLCSGGIQAEYTVKGSGQLRVKKGDCILTKWTEVSGTASVVRVDAFMDERSLGTGAPGWRDETPPGSWLYHARRVATQSNVAAGAIVVDIAMNTGQVGEAQSVLGTNSGTNSIYIGVLDEDNASNVLFAGISSAAGNSATIGRPGPSLSTSSIYGGSSLGQVVVGPGSKLSVYQAGAGAQGDTLTVAIVLQVNIPITPTWSIARSTNPGDVALAASSISAANTWQYLPGVTML